MAKLRLSSQAGRLCRAAGISLALHASLAPRIARADGASPPSATNQPNQQEAVVRYERALDLFNDGSFDAALLEFRRAYELAPNYRVLYNIALVNVQLNDYASALAAFEQYLAEGRADIPTARVEEVKRELARLDPRVATLDITTDEPGAEVSVDDLSVGKTPIAHPIRINAGRRRISVAAEGRVPQARVVEAAGGDTLQLKFQLRLPRDAQATAVRSPPSGTGEPSHVPWLAWGFTGALAAGTALSGVLALEAHSAEDATKNRLGATASELDSAQKKVQHWALATDVLLGATAVVGGITLYLTARSGRSPKPSDQARVTFHPGGVTALVPF